MFCAKCGTKLKDGTKFCICGADVREGVQAQPQQPGFQERSNASPQHQPVNLESKPKLMLLIALISGILFNVTACVIVFANVVNTYGFDWAYVLGLIVGFAVISIPVIFNYIGWRKSKATQTLIAAVLYIFFNLLSSILCFVGFAYLTRKPSPINKMEVSDSSKISKPVVVMPTQNLPVNAISSQDNYYGLRITDDGNVRYDGEYQSMPIAGNNIPYYISEFSKSFPSCIVVVLPQMGLLIISANGKYIAQKFLTPMSVEDASKFIAAALRSGINVKTNEKFGAYEMNINGTVNFPSLGLL